ncbi:MAG TPA: tRNA (uridine(34)/cytosine(34)/5-carboxymethylaminomethyluridine(34)-2'-O)-methyltransferase TrmL [Crenotrichaceae bacterium]|nr:tRNA (uridine(34)/cytosine(34)/5-carboxymethylaminomethyluridine(34)-2'-O)-methyltransferase TrmL [Crenotrichaceae bacterium]
MTNQLSCPINVVLYEPEIPPNTGNIIRLCANTGAQLHLIKPLGFELDDKRLRRAGLDYAEWQNISQHQSLDECMKLLQPTRLFALTTRGSQRYTETEFSVSDTLLFGPETRGLPQSILDQLPAEQRLYLPMRTGQRSINLSNSVAVVLYHAWFQLGFC